MITLLIPYFSQGIIANEFVHFLSANISKKKKKNRDCVFSGEGIDQFNCNPTFQGSDCCPNKNSDNNNNNNNNNGDPNDDGGKIASLCMYFCL